VPQAIPVLMRQLSRPESNEQVRGRAAFALANLVEGSRSNQAVVASQPDAIPALVRLLGSSNEHVQLGTASAVPPC
jgi:HEAT repeat protein